MLTVITPTYNRAHTLGKVYDSLCLQTNKEFSWLIIDDGSTDDTERIVKEWRKENKVRILYRKKENGGKASALNVALETLESKYAVCLDSDDAFYADTVEVVLKHLSEVDNDERCCGLLALRNNPDGTVMGYREIPKEYEYVTAEDIFLKLSLKTELICFYKTSVLKCYRFPLFPGEKFVSPAWMQYMVTEKHAFKTVWDKLCCCEYVADGLTKNKRSIIVKNPNGYLSVKRISFEKSKKAKLLIKHGIMYDCGCIIARDYKRIVKGPHRALAAILLPMAVVVYFVRFRKLMPSK